MVFESPWRHRNCLLGSFVYPVKPESPGYEPEPEAAVCGKAFLADYLPFMEDGLK
jgi:hypothetical protein